MKTLNVIETKLKELFKGTSFECYSYLEGYDNAKDLIESLQEQINQEEVIYYSNAIKYLADNDASLADSIEIACELGYELKNVNSELLATLLQQKNLNEELCALTSEIEACFEE
ncbi:MAG: hypothetical protein KBD25_05505 [Rickettsiaceae bacterium]|nr:hypothetical protein [Rickettsiaceae bacterium]